MKEYFLKLYQYNDWANKKVLACLKRQSVNDEKILSLIGHVLVAQLTWLSRIVGQPAPPLKLWDNFSLEQLEKMDAEAGRKWLDFVTSTESFDRELSYTNYSGDPFTNNVETIMIHTVNHATYHRAQIAMLLRQKGFEPVNTDFITYDRVIRGQLKD